jgi:hypothetical protein
MEKALGTRAFKLAKNVRNGLPFQASPRECLLTWNGKTLYGAIDTGARYQTHGAPFNAVMVLAITGYRTIRKKREPLSSGRARLVFSGFAEALKPLYCHCR